jgi:hypothetical protein
MLSDPVILVPTILIVDDEEFLLEYVRIVLLRAGFTVLTARTGEEAWQLILNSQNEIRLVLTDIVMPSSFDGFELADRVRRRQPDLPVLFMTGAPLEDSSSANGLVSKRMLLRKPFDPGQLLAIVRENLEAASASAQWLLEPFLRRARAKLETFYYGHQAI